LRKAATINDLPRSAPVFPLSGALLLPHTSRPLNVFEERYIAMIDAALGKERLIVLVQPRDAREESPEGKDVKLLDTGCLGRIVHFEETAEERYLIVLEGVCRVRLGAEEMGDSPYRRFAIDPTDFAGDLDPTRGEEAVDRDRFLETIKAYADFANIDVDWEEVEQTGTADLVNLSSMLAPFGPAERQLLLESPTLKARAEALVALAEVEMALSHSGHMLQ
jgi:uncharacterized protein